MKPLYFLTSILILLCSSLVVAADPTFTFGPITNYFKTAAPTATPKGGDVVIVARDNSNGIPKDGLDFFIGPDLQKAFTDTFNGVCAKGLSQECANALASTVDSHHAGTIAARFVGTAALLITWSAIAVVGLAIWLAHTDKVQALPTAVHLESSDIAQLQSYTATSFVFATQSATAAMTITKPPALSVTMSSAAIKTLTADEGKHHKGDVIVSLPTQPAQLLMQAINKWGGHERCKNITQKRGPGSGQVANRQAIYDGLLVMLPLAAPNQLLNGLGLGARLIVPQFRDAADRAAVQAGQQAAALMREFVNVLPDLINNIVQIVYMAMAEVCTQAADDLLEIVAEEWQFDDDPEKRKKCSNNMMKKPRCDWSYCQGNKGRCTVGENRDCECVSPIKPYNHPVNMTFWELAQQVIDEMTDPLGTPRCDTSERITLRQPDFEKLVTTFCKSADLSKDFSKDLIASEAGIIGYPPYTFSFKWKHEGQQCSYSCDNIFKAFVKVDSCVKDGDKIVMSATNNVDCGTASYVFKSGSKTVAGGPSIYKNQGNLDCGTHNDPGNANHFVSIDMMNKAANFFCDGLTGKGETPMVWKPGQISDQQKHRELHYNNHLGDPVYISTDWIDDPGCPATDFADKNSKSMCLDRLSTVIDGCDLSNEKGLYWWKQGGSFFRDCISWTIRRDSWVFSGLGSGVQASKDSWRPSTRTCNGDGDCTSSSFANACAGGTKPICKFDQQYTELGWCICE